MRKIALAIAATALLATVSTRADALTLPGGGALATAIDGSEIIELAQLYVHSGRKYCFYDDAWHGPGWYRCGYAWREGLGWGGVYGWNNWRHGTHERRFGGNFRNRDGRDGRAGNDGRAERRDGRAGRDGRAERRGGEMQRGGEPRGGGEMQGRSGAESQGTVGAGPSNGGDRGGRSMGESSGQGGSSGPGVSGGAGATGGGASGGGGKK